MSSEGGGMWNALLDEFKSPVNLLLISACLYIMYKMWVRHKEENAPRRRPEPELPPLKKQDFTLEQLKFYCGDERCDGRVLVAVNYKVFDVTKGKRFYGPGGPYAAFAGKDASRGLATFSVEGGDNHDDLSDLTPMQMESVREWEAQFTDRYVYVGKLLKPGEKATEYTDDEHDEAPPPADKKHD
ncbi:LOW QUALITY PROTEIN: membrane-associated progesterone receptor component 1-like [Pollicipes pollicipes]|uniref:LOW QUALITY PROTEIN: membrane-associated progesterone receptor component 1-like n=1 Tax=Pollicipes pollicipes TaxID=41117 RepID=UPI0018857D06|nr:LOW QUALITY PROTEIN: membrane-associated progesterone receptor component 1-like [Pollicipes pollicipes]